MSSDDTADDFVQVCGLTIPARVIRLGCDLENRGWRFRRVGDKLAVTTPTTNSGPVTDDHKSNGQLPDTAGQIAESLTDMEKSEIRKYRNHLLAVVDYIAAH